MYHLLWRSVTDYYSSGIMRQCNYRYIHLNEITDETICKTNPRYILPDTLNADYMFNNELRKAEGLSWYDLTTTDTTVGYSKCDSFIYSFVDNAHMRVQYNRPINYWEKTDIDTLDFDTVPDIYWSDATASMWDIDCFDGMFDSFFHRCDYEGFPIRSDNLCLLQVVKHIRLTHPPEHVLSMNEMFRNLPKLETIDMRGWEIPPWCLKDPNFHLFVNCPCLREICIDDPNVSDKDIRRWLEFNFNNLNDRSPITCDTIAAYNAGKYVFNKDLTDCESRKDYDTCFDMTIASYGNGNLDMNEVANWHRQCCQVISSKHKIGGYDWVKRKNKYSMNCNPYFDQESYRLVNPMGPEYIGDIVKRRQNVKDVYRNNWWGVPTTYDDISLSEAQWSRNKRDHYNNGLDNDNERVK